MSLKTTEEELLGAYSTKQLAMYLRFNNFIELAETVERVELRREAFEKLLSRIIHGARTTTTRRGSGGV